MDKEGLDTISLLLQMSLEKLWPKYEFSVETSLLPIGKRIMVKSMSQLVLDDYNEESDVKDRHICFFIAIHPSKLTLEHIRNTYDTIVSKVIYEMALIEG